VSSSASSSGPGPGPSRAPRPAAIADVDAIVGVINAAYEVEKFFVSGDRTHADDVREMMTRGEFLVLSDAAGVVVGAVYVAVRARRGYLGMLSVHPSAQGQGLSLPLVAAAEAWVRAAGCAEVDIRVVNLRTELFPFYERLGYVRRGTEPSDVERALKPFHFVVMSKALHA
jgi:GNAT superfamily N-acetyltransferase